MSACISKTVQSSFRSLLSPPKVGYVCFNDLNKKNFPIHRQHWRSSYNRSGSNPEILKLKLAYTNLITRKTTAEFKATVSTTSYFIFRKSSSQSVSTMENATTEIAEIPRPIVDNNEETISKNAAGGEADDDVDMPERAANMSEMTPNDTNEENNQKDGFEKKSLEEENNTKELSDSISTKNVDNVDKKVDGGVKVNHNKEERKPKNKRHISAGPLSKRALRKWKRQQKKGIELTGPLTTNPDPGYGSDVLSETEYYFENGLRKVYPYYHTFTSYVKGRWLGRTVMDVFTKEFYVATKENLLLDIEHGLLRVNDKIISADYKLKFNDLLSHKIHRHENPVVDTKLEIIEDNEHLIVVNKPSSIPCHPCGRYRYNSIVFILGKEYGYINLRNIYRLDRLTSGVLICAKTSEKTRELEDQILNKMVQKEYVCRVLGKFPDEEVEVDQPLECINHKISLWQVRPSGKPSKTLFKRLSYNGESSVVRCLPLTGRTHQIRVHLQYLGHPILNDPLYAGDAWGPESAKGNIFKCSIDEKKIGEAVIKNHNIGLWEKGPHPLFQSRLQQVKEEAARKAEAASTDSVSESQEGENNPVEDKEVPDEVKEPLLKRLKMSVEDNGKMWESRPHFDLEKWTPDETCTHCKTEYIDPQPKDLVMYLHALSYKGPDWEYRTTLPNWAQPDWKEDW